MVQSHTEIGIPLILAMVIIVAGLSLPAGVSSLRQSNGLPVLVDLTSQTTELPDPNITMPYVVVSSLVAGLLVIIIAHFYDRSSVKNEGEISKTTED
jgi:hypothetical protein